MGKQPNPPQEVNIQALMMDNQNVESIEAGLKQNLPLLFANLTVKPEGWLQLKVITLSYFYLLNLLSSFRMEINLAELFPDLENPLEPSDFDVSPDELEENYYFIDLVEQIID